MATQIGLALSGGGARGISHIGVLKVLAEAEITVSVLAGTSMGGILCALYAAGRPADEIEQLARSVRPLDVVQRGRTGQGLLGQDKIANWLRDVLGGDLTFEQLNLPLALIATDWETGDEVVIREGPVVDGLLATTALPGVFVPPQWRGRRVLDGALVNPVPFDVVRQMGADRVIAANTRSVLHSLPPAQASPRGRGMEPALRLLLARSNWTPMLHVLERSIGIMGEKLLEQRMRDAPPDLMIEVPLDGVGHFDFSKMDVCLAAGEEAARQRWAELIELRDAPAWRDAPALRDAPAPGRWWQTLRRRLAPRVTSASK